VLPNARLIAIFLSPKNKLLLTNSVFSSLPDTRQIEKLLKVVNESGAAGGDNLQFKPNPAALVGRGEGAEGEDEEGDGKYRPPKMLPTTMEQDEDAKEKSNKEKRREKEQRRRAQRSSLIKVRKFSFTIRAYDYILSSLRSFSFRTFAPGTCYVSGVLGLPKDAYNQTY